MTHRSAGGVSHLHRPDAGSPDEGMAERLEWPDRWMSANGHFWPLRTMSTAHLWAVLGYLRWFAPALAATVAPPIVSPADIRDWLVGRPVWIGIAEELARRSEISGELASARLAAARLEAAGPVQWERRN